MTYFEQLEESYSKILKMIRRKHYNRENLDAYFSLLDEIGLHLRNDLVVSKDLIDDLFYTCFQFIIESNYTQNGDMYFSEFQTNYSKIQKILYTDHNLSYLEDLRKCLRAINSTTEFDNGIIKSIDSVKQIVQDLTPSLERSKKVEKGFILLLFEITCACLFKSEYYQNPERGGLVPTNSSQVLEPAIVYFWEMNEVCFGTIGIKM